VTAFVWKTGFEIELMAPPGRTRADLAARAAARLGGRVTTFFHPQSEIGAVKGREVMENLTQGFRVADGAGAWHASFVDDVTLTAGLERRAAPKPGWIRIVGDDARLLRLAVRHCDAAQPLGTVLKPLAALFGTEAEPNAHGMVRVSDDRGVSVAIGAPLPGERERPCEIVTAPLTRDREGVLSALLADATALGFTIPLEGATHVHFDAAPLCGPRTIARLVALFAAHGPALKHLFGTNPACIRLGPWPDALMALTASDRFLNLSWPDARAALLGAGIGKYCDFNLLNLAMGNAQKHTFEVRILPVSLTAAPLLEQTAILEAMLRWCLEDTPGLPALPALIERAALAAAAESIWMSRAAAI